MIIRHQRPLLKVRVLNGTLNFFSSTVFLNSFHNNTYRTSFTLDVVISLIPLLTVQFFLFSNTVFLPFTECRCLGRAVLHSAPDSLTRLTGQIKHFACGHNPSPLQCLDHQTDIETPTIKETPHTLSVTTFSKLPPKNLENSLIKTHRYAEKHTVKGHKRLLSTVP
jgi:hypothetical protein